ncbi:hypothetical protein V1281_000475 [Nitrobacteraceae bacterium AZCC 2161]
MLRRTLVGCLKRPAANTMRPQYRIKKICRKKICRKQPELYDFFTPSTSKRARLAIYRTVSFSLISAFPLRPAESCLSKVADKPLPTLIFSFGTITPCVLKTSLNMINLRPRELWRRKAWRNAASSNDRADAFQIALIKGGPALGGKNDLSFFCNPMQILTENYRLAARTPVIYTPLTSQPENPWRLMMRKLSVTESQSSAQFRGTFSRRKPSVASANWAQVA